jgi:hypothetical protein
MRPSSSIVFTVVLLAALLSVRCASGPAPIVVRVTSTPSDSLARLRDRITLQPDATPFSLVFALIGRWFHNVGEAINERVDAELSPEIRIHVESPAIPQSFWPR